MTQKGENHDISPKRNQIRTGGGSDAERFHAPPPDALSFYHNALFAFLIAMLLFLFGAIDPIGYEIERALSNQLENSVYSLEHQSNDQAAYVLAFSQQITAAVKDELSDAGITFNELRNTPDALESMQNRLFDVVSSNMKLAPCSGAFCFLKTTVNDALPDKSYNGLYLKFANLYAENTIHNDVCLFRGFSTVAREKTSISIVHGSWKHKRGYSRKSME